jgi:hypothetical protein
VNVQLQNICDLKDSMSRLKTDPDNLHEDKAGAYRSSASCITSCDWVQGNGGVESVQQKHLAPAGLRSKYSEYIKLIGCLRLTDLFIC